MSAYDLQGQAALITGASRRQGIGAAIARELAQAGADVFVTCYAAYLPAERNWINHYLPCYNSVTSKVIRRQLPAKNVDIIL